MEPVVATNSNLSVSTPLQDAADCIPPDNATKNKIIREQLAMLAHADKCMKLKSKARGEVPTCSRPHCKTMQNTLIHLKTCKACRNCSYQHCFSSKQIIFHYKRCTLDDCPICGPFRFPENKKPVLSDINISDMTEALEALSIQGSSSTAIEKAASGIQTDELIPFPIQTHETASEIQTDQLVSFGVTPIQATKHWQQFVNLDTRNYVVNSIVKSIFPAFNSLTKSDSRIKGIITYARGVEAGAYRGAASLHEYNDLCGVKAAEIQREVEERRLMHNHPQVDHQN